MTRNTTDQEKKAFRYLQLLRESGTINMFGAGEFVASKFKMDKNEARKILSLWMDNFNEDGIYETITEK